MRTTPLVSCPLNIIHRVWRARDGRMKRADHRDLREQETGVAVTDLCRKHRVSSPTFYKRKAKLGGMDRLCAVLVIILSSGLASAEAAGVPCNGPCSRCVRYGYDHYYPHRICLFCVQNRSPACEIRGVRRRF